MGETLFICLVVAYVRILQAQEMPNMADTLLPRITGDLQHALIVANELGLTSIDYPEGFKDWGCEQVLEFFLAQVNKEK